ncbi:hypothetical protein R9C00_13245 [Flammeovirgaceae bacterium SG7u.111]|nr:hypothetical protein [Flammeovirgaceae bacterium SG7u.132]WPO38422.1 hypothetical protein R9C00_13245 [Flammeovirgaceae bacterium SG7u.111]
MKKLFKIFGFILLGIILLFTGLVATAWAMEERLTKLAVEELSEYLDAPIGMESVTFSLIKEFPLATFQFNGLWLGEHIENYSARSIAPIDTLAYFDKLYISVMSEPLLDNIFQVREVEIRGGQLKYEIDTAGISGYDYLITQDSVIEEQDTVAQATNFTLDKLTLADLELYYRDDQNSAKAKAYIEEIAGYVIIDSLTTAIATKGVVRLSDCEYGETNLYKMKQTDLSFDFELVSDSISIERLDIRTEGGSLGATGRVSFGNNGEIGTELDLSASDLILEELLKYVPANYLNEYELSQVKGLANVTSKVRGVYSEDKLPHVEADFSLSEGNAKWADYPELNHVFLKGSATNGNLQNNTTTSISIDSLGVQAIGNSFTLKGTLANLDELKYDFRSKLSANLHSLNPFIPDSVAQNLAGKVVINLQSRGVLPDSINDEFTEYLLDKTQATMDLKNIGVDLDSTLSVKEMSAKLGYKNRALTLDSFDINIPTYDIQLSKNSFKANWSGPISNLDSLQLNLVLNKLETVGISMKGNISVKNLNHPSFVLQNTIDVDLLKIKKFIPDSLIDDIKGSVKAVIHSEGTLDLESDSLPEQVMNIVYDQSNFDLNLSDVTLDMPDSLMDVQHLNAQVEVTPQLVRVQNLSGTYSGIEFSSDSTVIKNLYTTVVKDKPGRLEIDGVWRVGDLDYAMLETFMVSDSSDVEEDIDTLTVDSDTPTWDMDYTVKGKFYANSLKYGDALLEDISTLMNIKPTTYIIDQLKLKAFKGDINTSLRIEMKENERMEMDIKSKVDDLDIRTLLLEMENLYQEEIYPENIEGLLSTEEFFLKLVMVGDSIVYPDMRVSGDLMLENGAIHKYEPVSSLAPLIPGAKKSDLDPLVFKTINTHLFIFQNAIYVPKTYIVSNAFDISALGMQSFGDDYQYHLRVYVNDILFGKSNKRKEEQDEMGDDQVEEKRTSIYLRSYSLDGKDKNGPDSKKDRNLMGVRVRTKEAMLNLIFHPKLVSFETGVE